MENETKTELELNGALQEGDAPELCARFVNAGISGSLRVESDKHKAILYFEKGEIVFSVSNSKAHRLFQILLSQNTISKEIIVSIDGFTNDMHLGKKLIDDGHLNKQVIDSIFTIQNVLIIQSVWQWESGRWVFSPLARIKDGVDYRINFQALLAKHYSLLNQDQIINRFRALSEKFELVFEESAALDQCKSKEEAFLVSRIGKSPVTIEEIRTLSGLPNEALYPSLYRLWLFGILKRTDWKGDFPKGYIERLSEANFSLKKAASSYEEEKRIEEEARLKEEQEKKDKELKAKKLAEKEELSMERYLTRIEDAATHYELFALEPNAKASEIKKVYFYYAKNFHPDLHRRDVDDELNERIQEAFSLIARGYEVLKDTEARELYDFKMRKVIEAAKQGSNLEDISSEEYDEHNATRKAKSEYEEGRALFLAGNLNEALPHFERAVHYDDSVARYHAYLGKTLAKDQSQKHRAESELRKACSIDETNDKFRIMLAEVYIEFGLPARARGELQRLLKRSPNNSEASNLLAKID